MAGKEQHYVSYVLRMWQPRGETAWRASLLDPDTGERVGFASLEALLAYLDQRAQALSGGATPADAQKLAQ